MQTFNLLIAEDNDDHYFLVEDVLSETGIYCDLARVRDGLELMNYLEQAQVLPDLVLLDLNMPRKDGRESLREIKADRCFQTIPIIVLTTSHYNKDREECNALGVDAFISKPTSFDDFVVLLKEVLTLHVKKSA